jgi:hypothetical protein
MTERWFHSLLYVSSQVWYISGIVLRDELVGGRTIRVLLPAALNSWVKLPIQYPCELLALASSKEGEALLNRFNFIRMQNAHAMPDAFPLYGIEINSREAFLEYMAKRSLAVT